MLSNEPRLQLSHPGEGRTDYRKPEYLPGKRAPSYIYRIGHGSKQVAPTPGPRFSTEPVTLGACWVLRLFENLGPLWVPGPRISISPKHGLLREYTATGEANTKGGSNLPAPPNQLLPWQPLAPVPWSQC